ncbi:hypothetical protein [Amycolatopsis sp. cmx-4-61]|uniref:hypothetical protein n=1 Tax=Amycolatopsis sp. cmx-4-61 TaxID=2790937 RepID=UPI00397BAD33
MKLPGGAEAVRKPWQASTRRGGKPRIGAEMRRRLTGWFAVVKSPPPQVARLLSATAGIVRGHVEIVEARAVDTQRSHRRKAAPAADAAPITGAARHSTESGAAHPMLSGPVPTGAEVADDRPAPAPGITFGSQFGAFAEGEVSSKRTADCRRLFHPSEVHLLLGNRFYS